jgi:DNA-binding GntR family transcriptional regulator
MEKLGTARKNLDSMIYERLKSMIIDRKLMPGEKIYQDKLAHELGVSRTPLVGALKKLEHEKLITAIPRRGFYVRAFSKEEMVYIFELREVLEGLAARKASTQISDTQIQKLKGFFTGLKISNDPKDLRRYQAEDRRFHNFLLEVGGEELLSSILRTYNIITLAYQFVNQEGLVRHPTETIHEHRAIIKAITNRDSVKAEELARLHLKRSIDKMRREIEQEQQRRSQSIA